MITRMRRLALTLALGLCAAAPASAGEGSMSQFGMWSGSVVACGLVPGPAEEVRRHLAAYLRTHPGQTRTPEEVTEFEENFEWSLRSGRQGEELRGYCDFAVARNKRGIETLQRAIVWGRDNGK